MTAMCIGGGDHYWSPPVKSSLYEATVQSCARCGRIRSACSRPFHCPCGCGSHGACFFVEPQDTAEATP